MATLLEGQAQGITPQTAPPLLSPQAVSFIWHLLSAVTLSSEFSGLEYDIAYILEDMEIWQIAAPIIVTDTVSALTRQSCAVQHGSHLHVQLLKRS